MKWVARHSHQTPPVSVSHFHLMHLLISNFENEGVELGSELGVNLDFEHMN